MLHHEKWASGLFVFELLWRLEQSLENEKLFQQMKSGIQHCICLYFTAFSVVVDQQWKRNGSRATFIIWLNGKFSRRLLSVSWTRRKTAGNSPSTAHMTSSEICLNDNFYHSCFLKYRFVFMFTKAQTLCHILALIIVNRKHWKENKSFGNNRPSERVMMILHESFISFVRWVIMVIS